MKKLLVALLLCCVSGLASAQTTSSRTANPHIDPKTGRASFIAKMDKTPTTPPAVITKPAQRPVFRAVMDKKPSAPTSK